MKRTIVILIADFEILGLEELVYFTKWKLIETKERKVILTEYMEVDIIEIPKIYRLKEEENKLLEWIYFFEEPNSERVSKREYKRSKREARRNKEHTVTILLKSIDRPTCFFEWKYLNLL